MSSETKQVDGRSGRMRYLQEFEIYELAQELGISQQRLRKTIEDAHVASSPGAFKRIWRHLGRWLRQEPFSGRS
jgi:hypothetical protein